MTTLDPTKKIGVISPSWNGPGTYPFVFEAGLKELARVFGKDVVLAEYCVRDTMPLPEERAKDIHAMFLDPTVDLIVASIGGNDSIDVLPFLDKKLIRTHAKSKMFLGYSDPTTLLLYLRDLGVQTIHGPTIMSGFAEMGGVSPELETHIRDLFDATLREYRYPFFSKSTDRNNPWENENSFKKGNADYYKTNEWHVLQQGTARGRLIGGNLETIYRMSAKGILGALIEGYTGYMVFLETSEEKPSLEYLRQFFHEPAVRDLIIRSNALILGYPSYYSPEEESEIYTLLRDSILPEYGYTGVVVAGLPIGHSRPQWLLVEGADYTLDSAARTLTLHK